MSFLSDLHQLGQILEQYRAASLNGRAPVIRQRPISEIIQALGLNELVREGGLQGDRLAQFLNPYLENTTRLEDGPQPRHWPSC